MSDTKDNENSVDNISEDKETIEFYNNLQTKILTVIAETIENKKNKLLETIRNDRKKFRKNKMSN